MSDESRPGGFPIYASGQTGASRAVIVIQEAFGVTDHIRSVADRFAGEGYLAVAPHLFHRDGSPEVPYDDIPQAMTFAGTLTKQGITNDLNATTEFLTTLGFAPANIGIVGFCMGGTVAFCAATLGTVGAAVTFYGGGLTAGRFGFAPLVELAADLQCPWLGLFGDLDQSIPPEQVEELRRATDAVSVSTDIVRYADGKHGFHNDARPDAYNEEAALDAFQRTLTFLSAHLTDK